MKAAAPAPRRAPPASGPDPLALIQAYEDHFSCCVEMMRLSDQGFFAALRRRWRKGRAADAAPRPRPSG
jgi:hypothetical protein